jgi:methionyl-tRNA synthetase
MSPRRTFYVTTPIYYVNDEPHIGHTYTTVVADTLARYKRATGWDVRFLTGTDEHGQKSSGPRPSGHRAHRPRRSRRRPLSRALETLDISHDDFIRTTEARHALGVNRLIAKMTAAGDVYEGSYDGMYCGGVRGFYPASQIKDGRCPEQGHPVEPLRESSYFFRLSKYQQPLLDWIDANPGAIRPLTRRQRSTCAFIASGLRGPLPSRAPTLKWGIPWPETPRTRCTSGWTR